MHNGKMRFSDESDNERTHNKLRTTSCCQTMAHVHDASTTTTQLEVYDGDSEQRRAYSANRLFAFAEYSASASIWRFSLILVLYCVSALSTLVVFDTVPLQDPRTRWKANVTFWARLFIGALIIDGTIPIQARLVIPHLALSTKQVVAIVSSAGVEYIAAMMLVTKLWIFPVPFTFTVGGVPFMMPLNTLVTISLSKANKEQIAKYFKFTTSLIVQTLMVIMYPMYSAIFLTLDHNGQLAFVLLLPPMKLCFKYLAAKMNPIDDGLMPATMSSVDIFDAMYMTKCMQSAGSFKIGCAIILADLTQNYWGIWRLEKRAHALRSAWVNCDDGARNQAPGALLPFVFRLINKSDGRLSSSVLRVESLRFSMSDRARKDLHRIDSVIPAIPSKLSTKGLPMLQGKLSKASALVAPSQPSPARVR